MSASNEDINAHIYVDRPKDMDTTYGYGCLYQNNSFGERVLIFG